MEMNKIRTFFIILVVCFYNSVSNSFENKIILKINNQIITSFDLKKEIKYLDALNPGIKNLNKDEQIKFSKKSIIQEKIKKNEILKTFDNPTVPKQLLENLLKRIYSNIGLKNLNEFKKYLILKDVEYKYVVKKIENEALWNELIYVKFKDKLRINETSLREKIKKNINEGTKSYLLSEIVFEIDKNEKVKDKYQKIKQEILEKGFGNAALKYSISETSKMSGTLDWVDENSLNENIKKILASKKRKDYTKPITVPGGFLILKINDIKVKKLEINIEQELKKLINETKNYQLNKFSVLHFNKIKNNSEINEI
tara:strand:+ start:322 stop:1257 length:936 start_codon:yes stop_codon:yes gene_type:complete